MQKPYDNNDYYLRKFEEFALALIEEVKKKNRDYGSSVGYHGAKGIMPRLADKFFRLDNMVWNNYSDINYESAVDSAKDLAAYALIMAVGLDYWTQFKGADSC